MRYVNRLITFVVLSFLLNISSSHAKDFKGQFKLSDEAAIRTKLLSGNTVGLPYPGGALLNAVALDYGDIVAITVKDPKVITEEGADALNLAIQQGRHDITRLLLVSGVSPNAPIENGWYPLAEAAKEGDLPVMCLLFDYNVDISKKNDRVGNLAMALGAQHFDAAVLLMVSGYKPDQLEINRVHSMGRKLGQEALYNSIIGLVQNRVVMEKLCKSSQPSWRSRLVN
jgi:ankyrin repeat protein